jgi:hypothetical protein
MSKSQVSTESGQLHSAQWTDARDLIVTKARICTDSSVGRQPPRVDNQSADSGRET